MIARRVRRRLSSSPRALAAFIAVGTLAAIGVAGIAVGVLLAAIPVVVAIFAAAALAFWVFAIARMIELAQRSPGISLDCRDGRHLACDTCNCNCHKD